MENKKLIIAYIGDKCSDWGKLSLESVLPEADKIVFVWGEEDKNTALMLREYEKKYPDKLVILQRRYEHEHIGANGRARNAYLDYVMDKYCGEFCLVLDPDEVVDDIKQLKTDIQTMQPGIYHVKMRHTIKDLMHEDTTQKEHWCLGRLFYITNDLLYPEVEHPVLSSIANKKQFNYDKITIWHFAYSKSVMEIKAKYENHKLKSNMHNAEFLRWWYSSHITGLYPNEAIDLNDLPPVIIKYFELENLSEQIYFQRRMGLETKHFLEAVQWKEYFKPKTALDVGAGVGLRLFSLNEVGVQTYGLEISKWAIENTPFKKYQHMMMNGKAEELSNIFKQEDYFDLIFAYDVLEHLNEKDLLSVLKQMVTLGKNFLISVPVLGDPNLELDKTHKIKQSKEWWIQQIELAGIKVKPTPDNFLFKDQIIIGVKQ